MQKENNTHTELCEQMTAFREEGFLLKDISLITGIDLGNVSRIYNKKIIPKVDTYDRIINAMNIIRNAKKS